MFLQVFRLGYLGLGQVRLGFVSGAIVHIRLFYPFTSLSLDALGLLRPIGRTVGLGQGYYALGSVFLSILLSFASRTIAFCAKLHFQTLLPF